MMPLGLVFAALCLLLSSWPGRTFVAHPLRVGTAASGHSTGPRAPPSALATSAQSAANRTNHSGMNSVFGASLLFGLMIMRKARAGCKGSQTASSGKNAIVRFAVAPSPASLPVALNPSSQIVLSSSSETDKVSFEMPVVDNICASPLLTSAAFPQPVATTSPQVPSSFAGAVESDTWQPFARLLPAHQVGGRRVKTPRRSPITRAAMSAAADEAASRESRRSVGAKLVCAAAAAPQEPSYEPSRQRMPLQLGLRPNANCGAGSLQRAPAPSAVAAGCVQGRSLAGGCEGPHTHRRLK